ncbi:hypothetical protein JYB64_08695 [Algoriphagus aestuarii]|nr:hypothetical protein [Algoriphagus aestuarii]
MSTSSSHIVENLTLDFRYRKLADARWGNEKLEEVFHSRLNQTIEEEIEKVFSGQFNFELDNLEIDLGKISKYDFENSLGELIRKELSSKLREFLRSKRTQSFSGQSSENVDTKHFLLEALSTYLQKGYYPIWLDSSYHHEFLFAQLIGTHPLELKKLIVGLGATSEKIRKRLAFNFSDHQIDQLIRVLEPNEADWMILYKKNIRKPEIEKAEGEKDLVLSDQIINFFILNFLLQRNGSRFNRIAFSKNLLEQISAHYNLDLYSLIERLYKVADQVKLKSLLLVELKETLSMLKTQSNQSKGHSESKPINTLKSPWKLLIQSQELHGIESDSTWTFLNQSERLNFLLKKDPDFITKLSAEKLEDIISILAGSDKDTWHRFLSFFWEEYALNSQVYTSRNDYRKKILIAYANLSKKAGGDKTEILFEAIHLELNLDSSNRKASLNLLRKDSIVGKGFGNISNQLKEDLNRSKEGRNSEDYIDKGIDFESIIDENYGKAILKFIETGVLEKPDQQLNLQDLRFGFASLLEKKSLAIHPFIVGFSKNTSLVSQRLILLMRGLKTELLFEYLLHVNSDLAPFLRSKKNQNLVSRDKIKSQDESGLKILLTETSHLYSLQDRIVKAGLDNNEAYLEAFQFLFSNRDSKETTSWDFVNKLLGKSSYLGFKSKEIQRLQAFLEIRKRDERVGNSGISLLNSFSGSAQKIKDIRFGLDQSSDFKLIQAISILSGLSADILQKTLKEILIDDFRLGLAYLSHVATKGEQEVLESKAVFQKVHYLFSQIKQNSQIRNLILANFKTQISASAYAFYLHLRPSQWSFFKSVFGLDSDFSFEILATGSLEKEDLRKAQSSNTEFVKSMISLLKEKGLGRELVSQFIVLNELLSSNREKLSVSEKKIRELILNSILVSIKSSPDSTKSEYLKTWVRVFHESLLQSIGEELILLEWKYRISESNQLSSELKENLSRIFSNSNKELDAEHAQNFLSYLEAYSFLKRKGYLPWWSPIRSLEKFMLGILSIGDKMELPILQQLDSLFDLNSLKKVFSKLSRQTQMMLHFQLKSSKSIRREIEGFDKLYQEKSIEFIESKQRDGFSMHDGFVHTGDGSVKAKTSFLKSKISKMETIQKSIDQGEDKFLKIIEFNLQKGNENAILNGLFKETDYYFFIKNLISLAPKMYLKNLTPGKWKLLVIYFGYEVLKQNHSSLGSRFYFLFFNYLKRKHASFDWKSIFYALLQNEEFIQSMDKNLVGDIEKYLGITNKESTEIEMINENDQVAVSNGGLVICWPFLNMLFTKLGWLQGIGLKSEEEQSKACLMLQFLAFGDTDFPEYEMLLNKILTGMTMEQHLDATVSLTEDEKSVGLSLFDGIRANWEKMNNSSTEAIREGFIQREGILEMGLNLMVLKIERKTIDILLDSMPWGISMVKLPWMKTGLEINWR